MRSRLARLAPASMVMSVAMESSSARFFAASPLKQHGHVLTVKR